jgi:hypothetical protein
MINMTQPDITTTYWEGDEPTLQIKGAYIYAFSRTATKGLPIAVVANLILNNGITVNGAD